MTDRDEKLDTLNLDDWERTFRGRADAEAAVGLKLIALARKGGAYDQLQHEHNALQQRFTLANYRNTEYEKALRFYSEICDCYQKGINEPHDKDCQLQVARRTLKR